MPEARVGHLGMYRDEEELSPVGYYESIPEHGPEAEIVLVDPMLATGGSADSALARLKERGAKRLRFVCLVAAPEGLEAVRANHPDVPIFCASVDRELDERGYIRPGLGDAGDRPYGTGLKRKRRSRAEVSARRAAPLSPHGAGDERGPQRDQGDDHALRPESGAVVAPGRLGLRVGRGRPAEAVLDSIAP